MKTKISIVISTFVGLSFARAQETDVSKKNQTSDSYRRILYGEIANPKDFPFLVRIHKGEELCGGSIINNYFILTAAHCIIYNECSLIEIFPSNWVDGTVSRGNPVQCYVHEKYTGQYFYDIGLIRTLNDLLQDEDFQRIPLPAPGTRFATGTRAVLVGWGDIEDGTNPDRLLRGDVTIEDWETCNYKYKHHLVQCVSDTNCPVADIPRRGLCTQGSGPRPVGSCSGDSGGPAVVNGVLAGVGIGTLGYGEKCKMGGPSLHMNVADFLPWIYSITEPNKDTSQIKVVEESPVM